MNGRPVLLHGGSFLATHDRRVVFGLGKDTATAEIEILWPSGLVQSVIALALNRYHQIVEPIKKEVARIALSPSATGQL